MKKSTYIILLLLFILHVLAINSIYFNVKLLYVFLFLILLDGIGIAIIGTYLIKQHINKNDYWMNLHGKGESC
jgi:hypothetical protein